MKKILFLLTIVSLTLSSCIKEDDTYKKMEPILPGLNIYTAAVNQNSFSFLPAEMGLRLAMLLAEAKGEEDFSKVLFNNQNVKNALFGADTKIEKLETGNYKITFRPDVQIPGDHYFTGALQVMLNGKAQLNETSSVNSWTVVPDQFKIQVPYNGGVQTLDFKGGKTVLFSNGTGTYTVAVNGVSLNLEPATITSNWTGSFTLTPPDATLAYSLCKGKEFKATGSASGPSFYTFNGQSSTSLRYTLVEGSWQGSSLIQIGEEKCSLIGLMDYNPTQYPSPDVTVVRSVIDGKYKQSITYNGVTVTL